MRYNKCMDVLDSAGLAELRASCRKTQEVSGVDVWDFINGNDEVCRDKELLEQISIYTVNCFVFREYLKRDIKPGVLAGYSIGLYSALHCSGVISYSDGINLIAAAYSLMKEFLQKKEKWGMAVVTGLDYGQIQDIIRKLDMLAEVFIINENNQYSMVLSGTEQGIGRVCSVAGREGAINSKQLAVSMPYHTGFMNEPAILFRKFFDKVEFKDPSIMVISAITQDVMCTAYDARRDLYRNIKHAMSWVKTIEKAADMGFKKYYEIGLGDSLCRMSALIRPEYRFLYCRDAFREVMSCV